MYGNNPPKSLRGGMSKHIQAIELWSDWNSQLQQWAVNYIQALDSHSEERKKRGFGYTVVHSEDLVASDRNIRFSEIYRIAQFVGSNLSLDAICCMAVRDTEFMGSHDRTDRTKASAEAVTSRYGKWRMHTDRNPKLLQGLYEVGAEGLKTFGYDPLRPLDHIGGYDCQLQPSQCRTEEDKALEKSVLNYLDHGQCEGILGIDYKGGKPVPNHYPCLLHLFDLREMGCRGSTSYGNACR
jgi:hypothetical protein